MYQARNKRKKGTQLIFIYSLMTISVVLVVAALVLVMLGYRFNRFEGTVEQGGLVQFDSRPTGANITVDQVTLSTRTAGKITLTAGGHAVSIWKDGYTTWKKDVTVKPGSVLWLNYARLFPVSPVSAPLMTGAVDDSLSSPDSKWLAAVASLPTPAVTVVDLNSSEPHLVTIPLSDTVYTAGGEGDAHSFAIESWDKDSRHIILRHSYGDKQEFLTLDTRGNRELRNISSAVGVSAAKIEYQYGSVSQFYALAEGDVIRRINLDNRTLSAPLVTNVADFSQFDAATLTFSTKVNPTTGVRAVGYLTEGADKQRNVRSYTDDGTSPLMIRIDKYYGDTYMMIGYGNEVEILKADLPSSGSDAVFKPLQIAKYTLDTPLSESGFSPIEARFVYARAGEKIAVYDLELKKLSRVTLAAQPIRSLDWVDQYHFTATTDNRALTHFDFDGSNAHTVSTTSQNQTAAVAENDKYIYHFVNVDTQMSLMRTNLTIE